MGQRRAPYGTWRSPITADLIASGTIGLDQIALDGEDIYWIEARPAEGGRHVVVRRMPDGRTADVTPPPFSARTRVHEYGGGAYAVSGGTVYFSNFADQRLYRQDPGASPRPITPAADLRYADGVVDLRRGRLICVREDHTVAGREPVNTLVSVPLDGGGSARVLVSGHDFYASPRLSRDGDRLAWLAWNHPNMPWDGTDLWVADVAPDGPLGRAGHVAGGPAESIFQPEWSPDGVLYFVSDRTTGWWNLYRCRGGRAEAVCDMEAEFAVPQWVFGMSTYGFESPERLLCAYKTRGAWHLGRLDASKGTLAPREIPSTQMWSVRCRPEWGVWGTGSPIEPASLIRFDLGTGRPEILRRSTTATIDPGYLSRPDALEFPTEHGRTAHAFFYSPHNRDYAAPAGERPPLVVRSHGGPTGAVGTLLNLEIQFWTSRGFAVLDVNYGGSTGYGRPYRERLYGQWGIVDVDDCVNGARYAVEQDLADPRRLIIQGGSAGGYTTLCALTFRGVFAAGASYYGISDLEAMRRETHKFESRYLDRLIGPYPERRDLYRERSPIHFIDRLSRPLILFQGLEDRVVPPNQAEMMFEAVRRKGIPVAYIPFAGEQHGFRRAETIKRTLEAELYFYSRVFGFAAAEPLEPVHIENL
ncbi:MAG TPA: S9 family peptidase [bacterium]|nr:S9 family peptidase [bacterium]